MLLAVICRASCSYIICSNSKGIDSQDHVQTKIERDPNVRLSSRDTKKTAVNKNERADNETDGTNVEHNKGTGVCSGKCFVTPKGIKTLFLHKNDLNLTSINWIVKNYFLACA